MREITVFTEGDSLDLNAWSNVPYLFTKALEAKGIRVNRVNIYSNKYVRKTIWKYLFSPILSFLYQGNIYSFEQTSLNRYLIRQKIRKSLVKYRNSELNVYLSYSYLEKSRQPNVLFSDWTSEYVLRYRLKRKPYIIEDDLLKIQRSNIQRADMVISLFPDIASTMEEMYSRSILYLGQNVINNVYEGTLDVPSIISLKKQSNILLFIGRKNYLEGASMLIRVFPKLRRLYPNLELHIIGLKKSDFANIPNGIYCHGYLDKSNCEERKLYYDLILKSKVFLNPTPLWGGYSSTVEAMYFYTPVIISNYGSFVNTFGEEINFGYYIRDNQDMELYNCVLSIMESEEYESFCLNAHESVKSFTWDCFVDHFLERVEPLITK